MTTNNLSARWDLKPAPDVLIWQEVADGLELVPLLVDHAFTFFTNDAEAVDHASLRVLAKVNIADAFGCIDR